jgi:hypothetical protein
LLVFYGYNFNDDKYSKYEIEVVCDKARYGKVGTYVMGFNGSKCKFYMNSDEAMADNDNNKNKTKISKSRVLPNMQNQF